MGILVNDGLRKPATRIQSLHFAAATPYETQLHYKPDKPERVLAAEVARPEFWLAALSLASSESMGKPAPEAAPAALEVPRVSDTPAPSGV